MILANSLIDGFLGSNLMGQGIVLVQILLSVVMVAAIIGKWKALAAMHMATRRFLRDFASGPDSLDYYIQRRPTAVFGLEWIYKECCERLLKMLTRSSPPPKRRIWKHTVWQLSPRKPGWL